MPALLSSSLVAIALGAFVSTNLDDLFLLVSLFIDAELRKISVVVGQFIGMSLLVVISIFAALFAISIPGNWIWTLGFAPLSVHRDELWLFVILFGFMTVLWCFLGYHLTSHRLFGNRIKRYARFVIPFILIGIGVNVLSHR